MHGTISEIMVVIFFSLTGAPGLMSQPSFSPPVLTTGPTSQI